MHTLSPSARLMTLALVGVVAGAIMTSPLQQKGAAYGDRNTANATSILSGGETKFQNQYASTWKRLKTKSEAQIRDNDKKISLFKSQSAKANQAFRATYDRRVAELERRNIALKRALNDYAGDRGEIWAEYK